MRTTVHACLLLCSAGFVLCTERPVFPALGEPLESIARDQRLLQATQTVQQERAFTVHILTGPGAVVRHGRPGVQPGYPTVLGVLKNRSRRNTS